MNDVMHHVIALLAEKKNLPREMTMRAVQVIMNGGATPAQMAAFLMGLRIKGESVAEIIAAAEVLRVKAAKIHTPENCIDTCGTGGDARSTYNISTATALVLATCGVPVAKHGNRSVSSKSGSADVLEKLGVKIDADIPVLERCLRECNFTFLMAPKFHPAMRHVAPIRHEMGIRTIFNLIGPLSNPVNPAYQLLGVYARDLCEPMAHVLKELGTKSAWVVHGSDGLDELTLTGKSFVVELKNGEVRSFETSPEDAGLAPAILEDLKGGTAEQNAKALIEAISGMENAYRRAILFNGAAGLVISGKAPDLKAGVEIARKVIDSGDVYTLLMKLARISNEKP